MTHPNTFMLKAIEEAKRAASLGEVPVGAVVVCRGEIISRGHNEVETKKDATAHAEVLALKRASKNLQNWRLNDCSLYVTLEPCPMCIGALLLSRVRELYFGCKDPRLGAVGSHFDLSCHPGFPHSIEVYPEVMEQECRELLQDFFTQLRQA